MWARVIFRLTVAILLTALALKLVLGEYGFSTVSAGGFLGAVTVTVVFPFAYELWLLVNHVIGRAKEPYVPGSLVKRWFGAFLFDDWSDKKTKKRKRKK